MSSTCCHWKKISPICVILVALLTGGWVIPPMTFHLTGGASCMAVAATECIRVITSKNARFVTCTRRFLADLNQSSTYGYDELNPQVTGLVTWEGLLGLDGSISEPQLLLEYPDDEDMAIQPANSEQPVVGPATATASDESDVLPFKGLVPCPSRMRDVIPCRHEDVNDHCGGYAQASCLVTVPSHYVQLYKWPLTHIQARTQNVPNVPLLQSRQARAWVEIKRSIIFFLPGGPMYANGASDYLDHLTQLVPHVAFGKKTRVVLDVGCGTGSLSVALEQRGVVTLCVAQTQSPDNGIQLVLERGYPGLLMDTILSMERFPYPSEAFDLLHCAACNLPWSSYDGRLLFEADRILRRGGFFVWILDASEDQGLKWSEMHKQAERICWELTVKTDLVAVWHKPTNITTSDCYHQALLVSLCPSVPAADDTWKIAIKACLVDTGAGTLVEEDEWKARLVNPPQRLERVAAAGLQAAKAEAYIADLNYWVYITDFYVRFFGERRVLDIRNVLDMSAGYGGFAAALALKRPHLQWWVLNVVPIDGPDRLPVIFDRGLLGVYHDWCPMRLMVQEMDRLLRPGGFALIRDRKLTLQKVQYIAEALHWKTSVSDTESGPMGTDKLLHCQKINWHWVKPQS